MTSSPESWPSFLLLVAASLATTLKAYRKRRQRARDSERALGRTIIAELPTSTDLVLVTEDETRFYYGDRSIDKDSIAAVRVLINGAPIAACRAGTGRRRPFRRRASRIGPRASRAIAGTSPVEHRRRPAPVLIECGAIRERVSQELARAIFDAVKRDMETRDRDATEGPGLVVLHSGFGHAGAVVRPRAPSRTADRTGG